MKKKIQATKKKPYDQMNTKELAEATREFDQPFAFLKGRRMSAAGIAAHQLARKKK